MGIWILWPAFSFDRFRFGLALVSALNFTPLALAILNSVSPLMMTYSLLPPCTGLARGVNGAGMVVSVCGIGL